MQKRDILRYVITFIITSALFISVIWLSSYLNDIKLSNIKNISNKISIDISSSETEFQLLQGISCKDVSASTLSPELNDLSEKISYSEKNSNKKDDVTELKQYYSLLEIKDYLLMQKIKEKCNVPVVPVFYFYITNTNCTDCVKEAAVLNKLRDEYPELRVYSFDYNLQLSALQTLMKLFKVTDTHLPALYMNDQLYTGYQSEEDINKILPELAKYKKARLLEEAKAASSTATSTK